MKRHAKIENVTWSLFSDCQGMEKSFRNYINFQNIHLFSDENISFISFVIKLKSILLATFLTL